MYLLHFTQEKDTLDGEYVIFVDSFPLSPKDPKWKTWRKPGFKLQCACHLDSGRWVVGNPGMLPDHQPLVKS